MNEWEWQLLEAKKPVDDLRIAGIEVEAGSRVRLRPQAGGDIMDIALAGKTAVIEGIEQDYEGKVHVWRGRGRRSRARHRLDAAARTPFLFRLRKKLNRSAERMADESLSQPKPRILVAGIGNIFLGDDAFGVEVARRLSARELPRNVRVTDFGIRGYDLAYALLDGYDTTILIDACPRGEPAGTLYVIEPDLENLGGPEDKQVAVEAHSMNPLNVLRLATSMGPAEASLAGRMRAGHAWPGGRPDGAERADRGCHRRSGEIG